MKEYMMALDQGTTSSRCILFDKMGISVQKHRRNLHRSIRRRAG